jgi:serine/threonine protein kinase
LRVLAIGGMGDVYDVEDVSLGRHFVLKTLHRELAAEGDLRRQMRREARVLGRIDHVNVVRVFTAGVTDDDVPFFVMEKLVGASLREVLRSGAKIPMRGAVRTVIDLLLALDHVHEMGIVHCDLKPENIFLHDERGSVVPKLLDFGVVRLLVHGEATMCRGGTLRYSSPEQVRGEAVGPRSDVYAMGLVLYEMLAGRSPFRDLEGASEIAEAQLSQLPPPIAGVPSGLRSIICHALAKDPVDRPRGAFEFARELKSIEGFLDGELTLDHPVLVTRAMCEEITREIDIANVDTVRDMPVCVSNCDLLTGRSGRHATGDVDGGGGRCDGVLP